MYIPCGKASPDNNNVVKGPRNWPSHCAQPSGAGKPYGWQHRRYEGSASSGGWEWLIAFNREDLVDGGSTCIEHTLTAAGSVDHNRYEGHISCLHVTGSWSTVNQFDATGTSSDGVPWLYTWDQGLTFVFSADGRSSTITYSSSGGVVAFVYDPMVLHGYANPGTGSVCEGDCDSDSECGTGLVCKHRDAYTDLVPGCGSGGLFAGSTWDYCYAENGLSGPSTYSFAGSY